MSKRSSNIAERQVATSHQVYYIREDLEAYYNRVRQGKLQGVLDEMDETRVVSAIKETAESVSDNLNGQSIVQVEYLADTLDRWAEQLIGPG